MYLKKLEINNYRNLKTGSFTFDKCRNILLGNNGAGKTNFLEAISFLSTVSSFRKIGRNEFINWNSQYCYLECEVIKEAKCSTRRLELGFDKSRKMGKVDGITCKRLIDYLGNLSLIIFLPQDLNIVTEFPKLRRSLIDRIAYNFIPGHIIALQEYNKIKTKRNAVLKGYEGDYNEEILNIFNEQFINYGIEILNNRFSIIARINDSLSKIYEKLTGIQSGVSIRYLTSMDIDLNMDRDSILGSFKDSMRKLEKEELKKGITLCGPHLDDIEFLIGDKRADLFASLGQQRMLVIAVKLCEMIKYKELHGEYPVILLDDIFVGLDKQRAGSLIEFFPPESQVFMTTTHLDSIKLSNSLNKIYKITNGCLKKC